tara:strand:+ start:4985 stop:5863 length:879 start_codon:yes stop_codon:yes gene_type:complete
MEKDQIFILKDRGVAYISGEDSKDFLQNIVTNDINKVTDISSCFASLLTPQGKYLFDFIIVKYKQGYFLDCEKNQINQLVDRLNIYKLNSKIEILNLSNEFEVAVISKEKFLTLENAKDIEGNTIKYNKDPVVLDPRSKNLGGRLIANLEKLSFSLKSLGLKSEDPKKYYTLSHKIGIPQVNTGKLQEKIFGLECNFEELNGIDFKKGCYVGQENTARMKLKSNLRRKLLPLKVNEKLSVGSNVIFNNINIGKVLISEPYPFALIKLFDPNFSDFKNKEILADNKKATIITF